MGYVSFFENFIQIVVLLFAWLVVLLAFFILAIQLFVTLIEFKLTTLAGFVLIPFGLFGKTAFLRRARARQRRLLRRQGAGARRHRRHRLDAVRPVHRRLRRQSADDRGCHGARAGGACRCLASASSGPASPPVSSSGRAAARRRRGRRHGACGRRPRASPVRWGCGPVRQPLGERGARMAPPGIPPERPCHRPCRKNARRWRRRSARLGPQNCAARRPSSHGVSAATHAVRSGDSGGGSPPLISEGGR